MEYSGEDRTDELKTGGLLFSRNDGCPWSYDQPSLGTHSLPFQISDMTTNHEVNSCAIFPRPLNQMAFGGAPHLQVFAYTPRRSWCRILGRKLFRMI